MASGQTTNSVLSASTFATSTNTTTNSKAQAQVEPKIEPAYSTAQYNLVEPKLPAKQGKEAILRVGRESSRPWVNIASSQPNPTIIHDVSTHEPQFPLLWLGQKPWQ